MSVVGQEETVGAEVESNGREDRIVGDGRPLGQLADVACSIGEARRVDAEEVLGQGGFVASHVASHEGIWECSFVGACSQVCPKDVDPAGAIQQTKITSAIDYVTSFLPGGNR